VLDPGGQPNPNDNGAKNLSVACDAATNREFSVATNGQITNLSATHLASPLSFGQHVSNTAIQLGDPTNSCYFADTANPGGVYIMAVCMISFTPSSSVINPVPTVDPRNCKYDAFKVKATVTTFSAVLSGRKFLDANQDGVDEAGEPGLNGWTINLFSGSTPTGQPIQTTTTADCSNSGPAGCYSFTITLPPPTKQTTTATFTVCEVLKPGWAQTGPTSGQLANVIGTTGTTLTGTLNTGNGACYVVMVPLTANSAVTNLDFFNTETTPPACQLTASGINGQGQSFIVVTVQDSQSGLKSVQVTELVNATALWDNPPTNLNLGDFAPVTPGDTSAHAVTATKIDQSQGANFGLQVIDEAGNVTNCDPVQMASIRSAGQPLTQSVAGVGQADHLVTIFNGNPGVSSLTITVNGTVFHLNGLKAGERVTIDVASALTSGANTVTLKSTGQPGGSASVLFGNI
jgi:hypothetical protein